MVNAWSLAGSIMNGTFEEDYPLMDKKLYIYESPDGGKTVYVREQGGTERTQIYPDLMNEVQASSPYNDGWTQQFYREQWPPFVPDGFKDKYENYQAVLADGWEFTADGFWIKCT